jgi:phage baseplate assembly protein W
MAYLKQIFDSSLSGGTNKRGEIENFIGTKALNNSVIMFLLSYRGEIIDYPNFGGIIVKYLNKPIDQNTANQIKNIVKTSLEEIFTPRLVVENISVIANYERNYYEIKVEGFSPEINTNFKIDEQFNALN